jgi:L-threonylcarbamoyladenylate synthase
MQILKATEENIIKASRSINTGNLVVYPTETVYGLGCDPFNIEAVRRVFHVKGDREKPLPILASSIKHAEKVACLSGDARRVAAKFWPGPLTIVVRKKTLLPDVVTCNQDTVGIRVPNHGVAVRLIELSGGLLIGTSANKTGEKPPQTVNEAVEQIGKKVDIVLDGGPTNFGISSTIVDFTSKEPKILREGPINLKQIMTVIVT